MSVTATWGLIPVKMGREPSISIAVSIRRSADALHLVVEPGIGGTAFVGTVARRRVVPLQIIRRRPLIGRADADLTREFAEVTLKFSQNVLDATAAWELLIDDPAKLAGLPDSAKEAAAESAKQKGQSGWRFTLQAPSVIAVLTSLDDRAIREQVWRAYNSRGAAQPFDNRPLIERILELRREKAQLLGYRDFADLVLADRMAKTGGRAKSFIDDLAERSKSAFAAENKELEAFRAEQSGQSGPLSPWDLGYWSEKLRVKKYDFDQEALRPYFPLERVVSGLFSTVQRLYGPR